MSYKLATRPVTLLTRDGKKDWKTIPEVYYTGLKDGKVNEIAKDINELNTIDADNMRSVMKMTGCMKDLIVMEKSIDHLGTKNGILEKRKNLLEALYFNVFDLVFKWMNQLIYEDTTKAVFVIKNGVICVSGVKESYLSLEECFDLTLVPILSKFTGLVNIVIETRFSGSTTQLESELALERLELNLKSTEKQIKNTIPTKTSKKKKTTE